MQNNDLYTVRVNDGQVQRLTTDGGETVFNGALDWVYNEELATRAAQPAYAWSPDGSWLIYLRLDESAVQNDPVTDYRPVPPTISYTRYPTAGTANPVASLHALSAQGAATPLESSRCRMTPNTCSRSSPGRPTAREAIYITVNRDHTVLELQGGRRDRRRSGPSSGRRTPTGSTRIATRSRSFWAMGRNSSGSPSATASCTSTSTRGKGSWCGS